MLASGTEQPQWTATGMRRPVVVSVPTKDTTLTAVSKFHQFCTTNCCHILKPSELSWRYVDREFGSLSHVTFFSSSSFSFKDSKERGTNKNKNM